MPIRFRCDACGQLMSISSRQAGNAVTCPMCGESTRVPQSDDAPAEATTGVSAPDGGEGEAVDLDEAARFVLRRARTQFDDMDLTPMVDVTFLLLIFFMITAAFSLQKGLAFPSPEPDKRGAVQSIETLDDLRVNSVIVEVDARNAIVIDDVRLTERNRLAETLHDKQLLEHKTELVLEADPAALHETVVAVIDAANEAGFQKIRLATRAGEE